MSSLDRINNQSADESRAELDKLMGRDTAEEVAPIDLPVARDDAAITMQIGTPKVAEFGRSLGILDEMGRLPGPVSTEEKRLKMLEGLFEIGGMGLGSVAGGPAGSVVGGPLGLSAFRGLQEFDILPQFKEGSRSLPEQLGKLGISAGTALFGEGLGQLGVKIASKIKPFAKSVSPQARKAQQLLGKGITIPPAQMSENTFVEVTQNILKSAIGSSGRINKLEGKAIEGASNRIRKFVDDFIPSLVLRKDRAKRMEIIQKAFKGRRDAINDFVGGKAKILDSVFSGTPKIDISKIKPSLTTDDISPQLIGKNQITFEEAVSLMIDKNVSDSTRKKLAVLMRRTAKGLDKSINDALRSARVAADIKGGVAEKVARSIERKSNAIFNNSIDDIIAEIPKFALFNTTLIKKIATEAPRDLVNIMAKKGNDKFIKQVQKEIDPEVWNTVEFTFMDDLLTRFSSRKPTGDVRIIKPSNLINYIEKQLTEGTFKSMFRSKGKAQAFLNFAEANRVAQKTPQSALGKMLIQMKQAGAAGQVLGSAVTMSIGGSAIGTGLVFFGLPPIIGKIFTNKSVMEALTTGVKIKAGTPEAVKWLAKVGAVAAREGFDVGSVEMDNKEDAPGLSSLVDILGSAQRAER